MEKLSFRDLVILAKSVFVEYDKLLCQDSDGKLVNSDGVTYERSDDETFSANVRAEIASDAAYDRLYALIKVLKGLYEYRPLPF